jgi:uncharacterized membrane protein
MVRMSELIALGFDSRAEAEIFGERLWEMKETSALHLRDAAEVLLGNSGKPRIRHASELVGAGALGGVFWGVFFALVFFLPGFGSIIAAGLALIHEKIEGHAGLKREFIEQLGETIQPGQAGWVLLADDVDEKWFLKAARGTNARVVRTSLGPDDEAALKEAFGVGERPPA